MVVVDGAGVRGARLGAGVAAPVAVRIDNSSAYVSVAAVALDVPRASAWLVRNGTGWPATPPMANAPAMAASELGMRGPVTTLGVPELSSVFVDASVIAPHAAELIESLPTPVPETDPVVPPVSAVSWTIAAAARLETTHSEIIPGPATSAAMPAASVIYIYNTDDGLVDRFNGPGDWGPSGYLGVGNYGPDPTTGNVTGTLWGEYTSLSVSQLPPKGIVAIGTHPTALSPGSKGPLFIFTYTPSRAAREIATNTPLSAGGAERSDFFILKATSSSGSVTEIPVTVRILGFSGGNTGGGSTDGGSTGGGGPVSPPIVEPLSVRTLLDGIPDTADALKIERVATAQGDAVVVYMAGISGDGFASPSFWNAFGSNVMGKTYSQYAGYLNRFIEEKGLTNAPIMLVGFSNGGQQAQLYGVDGKYKANVRAVVTFASPLVKKADEYPYNTPTGPVVLNIQAANDPVPNNPAGNKALTVDSYRFLAAAVSIAEFRIALANISLFGWRPFAFLLGPAQSDLVKAKANLATKVLYQVSGDSSLSGFAAHGKPAYGPYASGFDASATKVANLRGLVDVIKQFSGSVTDSTTYFNVS